MTGWLEPRPWGWNEILYDALYEDLGPGDLSASCLNPDSVVEWSIEAQAEGVLCGCGIALEAMAPSDSAGEECMVEALLGDGDTVRRGDEVLHGTNLAREVLAAERTALNFLMQLSGVSTLTSQFVEKVKDLGVDIVDTRKTVPGLRSLQKYAVRCGGGRNHRMGLYDGIMVKDNHIRACGSIREAVERARRHAGHMTKIEVECESEGQVAEAVAAGADIVMLDNMDPFTMADIAKKYRDDVVLEASGGVTLETVRGVATTGVHAVSVGALTHSAPALSFHLEIR
ncbi:MAG: carboxylating nicotinate-nucleotide diphosphorylase [Armatimonadetes bacterium]|nr:carboxylating nicotinate-nucleotide diphosphorylase [Armatimonadota bacterium]